MTALAHIAQTVYTGADFATVARQLFGNIKQKFLTAHEGAFQELSHISLGGCELSKIAASPHGVLGVNTSKGCAHADAIKVLVQLNGRSTFDQGSGRLHLKSNALVIYDPSKPYFLMNTTNIEHLVLQIPRVALDERALKRLSQPFYLTSIGDAQSSTLSALIKTSAENAHMLTADMRASVGRSLTCFAQGLICDNFQTDMISTMDNASLLLLRERIKSYVQTRLGDPDLSIEDIGRRMGCSTRYLHKAFQAEGTTLQRFIWKLRLDYSKEMLMGRAAFGITISEIALNCGFSSSSHFSRLFRQQFDMTPKELRASVLSCQQ